MVGLLLPGNNTEGESKCSIKTPDPSIQTSWIAGLDAARLGAGTGQSTDGELWEDVDGVMGL